MVYEAWREKFYWAISFSYISASAFKQNINMNFTDNNILLQSLYELFNRIYPYAVPIAHSNINIDVHELLNDAVPDMLPCWVKLQVKNEFEKKILNELDCVRSITQQTWKIIAYNIIKEIKESPEMVTFMENIQANVNTTVLNFQSEEKVGVPCSSNPRQIQQLAYDMSLNRPISTRIQALHILLHNHLSHVMFVSHDSSPKIWSQIRSNLQASLNEENSDIFDLSFKIHAKLINSTKPLAIKEGFISLVDGFLLYYSSNNIQLPSYNKGISMDNPIHQKVVRICHLILFTVKNTSRNYCRNSERFIEDIMARFFVLLLMKTSDINIVTPYDMISALDPNASWFTHLLYGKYAQHQFFSMLMQNSLVRNIVMQLVSPTISSESLRYASFVHSTKMFNTIVKYYHGRCLFPLATKVEDEPVTLEKVYLQVVNYLNGDSIFGRKAMENVLIEGIPVLIMKTSIIKSDSPLMRAILEPLPTNVPNHTAKALETVVQTSEGVRCLLGAHDAKTLLDYTAMALKDQVECTLEIKVALLGISGKMLGGHYGFQKYQDSQLITKVIHCFQCQDIAPNDTSNPLNEALIRFLTDIGSTPLGILTLSMHTNLLTHLNGLWADRDTEESRRCISFSAILNNGKESFSLPLTSMTDGRNAKTARERTSQGNSVLYRFLKSSKGSPHDNSWYNQLRKAYKASGQYTIKTHVVLDLVDQLTRDVPRLMPRLRLDLSTEISPESVQAATWVIRYGEQYHLLQIGPTRHIENLTELFCAYDCNQKDKIEFFVALAFLICNGYIDKCHSFLAKVSSLSPAVIIWPDKSSDKYQQLNFDFGHRLELLVDVELPICAMALKIHGISWWEVCRDWMSRCFFSTLGWDQILGWLSLCLFSQPDQSVYFCVALLKHLQTGILRAVDNRQLHQYLNKRIDGFQVTDYLSFMDKLAKRHGNMQISS